jgi:hypothetical protein
VISTVLVAMLTREDTKIDKTVSILKKAHGLEVEQIVKTRIIMQVDMSNILL